MQLSFFCGTERPIGRYGVNLTEQTEEFAKLPLTIRKRIALIAGCWNWTGYKFDGYGRLRFRGFRTQKAHRIIYELLRGPIEPGLELDHLCKNRSCVNPKHLEPVEKIENLRRSPTVGTVNAAKTHCNAGHEFTAENTYMEDGRKRRCRKCLAAANARYLAKKRGAA